MSAGPGGRIGGATAVMLAALVALGGCGGGGGGDGAPPDGGEPAQGPSIDGVAALEGAVAGQPVSLVDAGGHALATTTAADGSFSLPAAGIAYPALLRIDAATAADLDAHRLYAALDTTPQGKVLVTPLSTAVVDALAQGDAATLFATVGSSAASRDALAPARIDSVETKVRSDAAALAGNDEAKSWLASTGRLTALPPSLQLPTVADLVRHAGQALTLDALSASAATRVASLPVGCDVADKRALPDGSLRAACVTGANYPLSLSVAGSLKPYVSGSGADAEILAGGGRGPTWKLRDPSTSSEALQPDLRKKLKGLISDLWSDRGASFPETYGIDQGPVADLVDSIQGVSWHLLGKKLMAQDVSNTRYAYQALSVVVADASARERLFFPLPFDAVRLAAPTAPDQADETTLDGFGTDIETFARQWLADPGNQVVPAPDPTVRAVLDAYGALLERASSQPFAAVVDDARGLNAALADAAGRLPEAAGGLVAPARNAGNWLVDFAQNCIYPLSLLPPQQLPYTAPCNALIAREADVVTAFSDALVVASQATTPPSELGGAFYQRFLDALARHVTQEYEGNFALHVDANDLAARIAFRPVVVSVELHDGGSPDWCCLSDAEVAAPRSALLYHPDGAAVRFATDANGGADMLTTIEVPLVMRSFVAPPLSKMSTARVDGPFDVPYGSWSALVLACSQADAACMQRLDRSRFGDATTQGPGPIYVYGLSTLSPRIQNQGGIAALPMALVSGP